MLHFESQLILKTTTKIVKIPQAAPCIATLVATVSNILVEILWIETSSVEVEQLHASIGNSYFYYSQQQFFFKCFTLSHK